MKTITCYCGSAITIDGTEEFVKCVSCEAVIEFHRELTEDERRAIVESGTVWLSDGLRAGFAGIKTPHHCGVHSARPGFWACTWETARDVAARPGRRFTSVDHIWRTGDGWFGLTPGPDDYQTPADFERAKARGEANA